MPPTPTSLSMCHRPFRSVPTRACARSVTGSVGSMWACHPEGTDAFGSGLRRGRGRQKPTREALLRLKCLKFPAYGAKYFEIKRESMGNSAPFDEFSAQGPQRRSE